MHARSFLHRDLKPDNFLMGLGRKANQVILQKKKFFFYLCWFIDVYFCSSIFQYANNDNNIANDLSDLTYGFGNVALINWIKPLFSRLSSDHCYGRYTSLILALQKSTGIFKRIDTYLIGNFSILGSLFLFIWNHFKVFHFIYQGKQESYGNGSLCQCQHSPWSWLVHHIINLFWYYKYVYALKNI